MRIRAASSTAFVRDSIRAASSPVTRHSQPQVRHIVVPVNWTVWCRNKLERQQQHEDELLRVAGEQDREQQTLAWLQGAEEGQCAVWYVLRLSSPLPAVPCSNLQAARGMPRCS
jgi:hypothetical protein